ncbi:MAG: Slp family lipoprotein [Nitrospirota bacterium]
MKRILSLLLVSLAVAACAPVLQQEYLERGSADIPLAAFINEPNAYRGRLFLLGGEIVESTVRDGAVRIEARYIPVDERGRLKDTEPFAERFLAVYPADGEPPAPELYRSGERISIAGIFTGLEPGRIGDIEYLFPVFEIRDVGQGYQIPFEYVPYPSDVRYLEPSLPMMDPFWRDRPRPAGR